MSYESVVEKITSRLRKLNAEGTQKTTNLKFEAETLVMLKDAYATFLKYSEKRPMIERLTIAQFAVSQYWAFIIKPGTLVKVWHDGKMRYGTVIGPCNCYKDIEVAIPHTVGGKGFRLEEISECDIPQDIIDLVKKGGAK